MTQTNRVYVLVESWCTEKPETDEPRLMLDRNHAVDIWKNSVFGALDDLECWNPGNEIGVMWEADRFLRDPEPESGEVLTWTVCPDDELELRRTISLWICDIKVGPPPVSIDVRTIGMA